MSPLEGTRTRELVVALAMALVTLGTARAQQTPGARETGDVAQVLTDREDTAAVVTGAAVQKGTFQGHPSRPT